ncbi:hypothetical protein GCM10027577_16970 [Spirosoma fluminis]
MVSNSAPTTMPQRVTRIDKRANITRDELIAEYIKPGIPVVLTDATQGWKAMGKITPEFFKTHYGHLTKQLKGTTYTLAEYVDLMLASTPENPAPYPFSFNVGQTCPELFEDIKPEVVYGKSDRIKHPLLPKFMLHGTETYEFFLGGNGANFPVLHVDALFLHTQITQLYGAKEFIFYPPDQDEYMYPSAENPKISQVDVFNPDYGKHPLFRKATPITIMVEEGETVLFPTRWWHTTRIHEPCISLGRVHLNAYNWADFARDNYSHWKKQYPAIALPAFLYAKTLGYVMDIQETFS